MNICDLKRIVPVERDRCNQTQPAFFVNNGLSFNLNTFKVNKAVLVKGIKLNVETNVLLGGKIMFVEVSDTERTELYRYPFMVDDLMYIEFPFPLGINPNNIHRFFILI